MDGPAENPAELPGVACASGASGAPYRTPAVRPQAVLKEDKPLPDAELVPVFFVFWIASIVRVVVAVVRSETFGAEATLAGGSILLIPWLLKDTLRAYARRLLPRGIKKV